MDDTVSRCTCCHSPLFDHEAGRQACQRCQQRADDNLAALPGQNGLYAALADALMPGRGTGGPVVSGSRTAPIPARLETLSLSARGGVVTILQTWVEDWATYGRGSLDARGSLQRQCDTAVATLRFNLDWAAAKHPAFAEFAAEVYRMRRQCEFAVTQEKAEVQIALACAGCGGPVPFTLSANSRDCAACGRQYGFAELRSLRPIADRRAA